MRWLKLIIYVEEELPTNYISYIIMINNIENDDYFLLQFYVRNQIKDALCKFIKD